MCFSALWIVLAVTGVDYCDHIENYTIGLLVPMHEHVSSII